MNGFYWESQAPGFAIKEIFGDVPLPKESQRASQSLSSNQ